MDYHRLASLPIKCSRNDQKTTGTTKSHTHSAYGNTTYNQSNSCWLLMTLALNMPTKRMPNIYQMPSKTITRWNLIGLVYYIMEAQYNGTTKTNMLILPYQDKYNYKNIIIFEKDHLKIAHTLHQPNHMEMLPKVPSLKILPTNYPRKRKNESNKLLEAYYNMPELSTSHSLWHSAPLLLNNEKSQNSLCTQSKNFLITV